MTLEQFDEAMRYVEIYHDKARQAEQAAREIEAKAIKDAGIVYISRDPGFPGWTAEGVAGYFDTPREALDAKLKAQVPS